LDKISFEDEPKSGIFYFVPDPKTLGYTIFSSFDEGEEDDMNLHLGVWQRVLQKLKGRFRDKTIDLVEYDYRGLPRGRVIKNTNEWLVAWGGDISEKLKREVIYEFNLSSMESAGKVRWEIDSHEKMEADEKEEIEKYLGITITEDGIKVNKKKVKKSKKDIINEIASSLEKIVKKNSAEGIRNFDEHIWL
jgi:hypothetical protein